MAEFQEVIRQWQRMCYSTSCEKCEAECCDIEDLIRDGKVEHTEQVIMKWAAEHPEPVYPTWYEYLKDYYRAAFGDLSVMLRQPVPADIAHKLGIEPKEDT